MLKRLLLCFISFMLSAILTAQNMDVLQADKLKASLATSQDSSRALILGQLAEAYRDRDRDSSLMYANEALAISRQLGFVPGIAKSTLTISYINYSRGDLTRALDLGLQALDIAKKNGLRSDQAFAMIRIGNVYLSLKDYREALNYYHATRVLTANSPDTFFHAVTYWRAADAYLNLNLVDSAIIEGKKAEDTAVNIGNRFIALGVCPVLGEAYARKGSDSLALLYFRKNPGVAKHALAKFYQERNRPDSALFYAKEMYGLAVAFKSKQGLMASSKLLGELYEKTDPALSIAYYKITSAMMDSVYGAEKILAAKAVAYQVEERQRELDLAAIAWRNKVRIWLFSAGIILLLGLAYLLFRNNRIKQKNNLQLQEQKDKLEQTLTHLRATQTQLIQSEKMASLGELTAGIAHEIQNPLNFVNNFSDLNQELIEELKEVLQKGDLREASAIADNLKENEAKINLHGKRADGIVKSMLQHSRGSTGIKEPTDINKLVDEYIRLAFHGYRAKVKDFNVDLDISLDPEAGSVPMVRQDIGRVILNLLNNAFYAVIKKSADDPTYKPQVSISTTRGKDIASIVIEDNGMGIPEDKKPKIFQPFFTTKPTGEGTGLGLSLSYDIITKGHGGQLSCDTKPNEYTKFTITLPSTTS